jgi:hypothetical protein
MPLGNQSYRFEQFRDRLLPLWTQIEGNEAVDKEKLLEENFWYL